MQPGEYIILKVSDIEDRISDYNNAITHTTNYLKGMIADGIIDNSSFDVNTDTTILNSQMSINVLKELLTNPTDLYGVVEGVYREGFNGCIELDSITDYLNNLEL